ncbi:circularly permuted type 2 ATP-grasp protein [Microbacterium sp. 18062]|uniref:circularly permuted type 2 ATP-grasp protein n=1 Tax=Microbacterium sp. 18062 TaxID=2681410 RepID=UPI00135896D5|nr:circularly permuted type 2 ATP-grasp protein [Microbacterium sp. 18062]
MSVLRDYVNAVSQPTLPFAGSDATAFDGSAFDGGARYDELVGADGSLRLAWRGMASLALALTPGELDRVTGEIDRFLADDGVTYVTPDAGARPWRLDPMPLIIDAPSWAKLELGLAQRAELLNELLADLYGPRRLLRDGVIPAASVFAHSGFVRAAGHPGSAPQPLILSAADLGRDADGEWHVLADRVQAPSGLGFAMENRRVVSQVLPELYQESDLHRLEPYIAALRESLVASAPDGVDEPRVVVLSPGTSSETAFDQAFIANALGFPLVQGSDLVVRDGYVWMKPARWPHTRPRERVDVILRRVDAEWCDPLELRADSRLGVAGLAQAVRRGRVRLANGLGAGVLENPALMPFMPAICERLLGEQLRLPSVPTWWCGDPDSRAAVLARLADGDPTLAIRAIDGTRAALEGLSPRELADRIRAEGHRYVGQDLLALSQAPVWRRGDGADPRPIALRTFALRHGSSYRPLVGGLATVSDRVTGETVPTTKDVWVLKAAEADLDQGLGDLAPSAAGRTVSELAPRALEDMFWAGRYAERAEDSLRLVLTAQQQFEYASRTRGGIAGARALHGALVQLSGAGVADPEDEFRRLLLDTGRPGTAAHSIVRLRAALEGVRDQLSGDTWRVFSAIDRARKALAGSERAHRTAESGGRMLTAILSFQGVTASMIRDPGWHMIEAGRALERALQVCRLLATTAVERRDYRADRSVLEALLTASESIVTYRRRYQGSVRIADALELVLLDPENPRSVAFCLEALRTHLAAMPASTGSSRPERLVDHLIQSLEAVEVADLVTTVDLAAERRRIHLEDFLADTIARLAQIGESIEQVLFEAGPPPLALSALSLVEEMEASA